MKIRWHGMLATSHSWSYVSQYLVRSMRKLSDHGIFLKSTNSLEHFPDDLKDLLIPGYHGSLTQGPTDYITKEGQLVKVDPKVPLPELPDPNGGNYDLELAYTILYQMPRRFFPQSKCKAVIWNFESSVLPAGWEYYLKAADYLLPSSQFSYDIFAANGISKDQMLVVPHGVDTDIFNPNIPPFKLKTEKKIKFLHNAIPHHRKLHERVIKGYLDTFTGDDDVCLILKTKLKEPDKDKAFEVDIRVILEREFKGRKNPPEIEVINTYIPDIGSLYTACDAVVSMSATEGFCLLPETLVDTNEGPIAIEKVNKGDKVIGVSNNTSSVTKTTQRYINESVIGLRRLGESDVVWCTQEHPILCIKRKGRKLPQLRKELQNGLILPTWQCAKNIEQDDFVALSKPIFKKADETIRISDFIDCDLQSANKVYLNSFHSSGISYRKIANICNSSRNTVSKVLNCGLMLKNNNHLNIISSAEQLGWFKPSRKIINNIINLTPEIAEFFGLYIAEGYSSGSCFGFASHIDESYARGLEKQILLKIFNQKTSEFFNKTSGKIEAYSLVVAKLFSVLFGHDSKTKTIPRFLWGSKFVGYILKGLFYGDGTVSGNRFEITTSSPRLVNDISQILLSKSILSYVYRYTHKDGRTFFKLSIAKHHEKRFETLTQPVKYNNSIILSKNKYRNIRSLENKNYFFVPVLKILKKSYKGLVHNLEVENDESYTCNGLIVHNCLPLLEALACNSLVIAPNFGGQLDFLNDDNSLLVNTGEMIAPPTQQYWSADPHATVGDPDTKHFGELLRRVYENPEQEKSRVKEAAKQTVEKFNWDSAAQMILDLPIPNQSKRFYHKRKVLYIIPYAMAGGGEVWVKEAINKLNTNVYEPHIALVSGANDALTALFEVKEGEKTWTHNGITFENLKESSNHRTAKGDYSNIGGKALKCLIESGGYSIIHFYNSFGVYHTLKEAWNQGLRCRIVETVHSELKWHDSMTKVSSREKFIAAMVAVSNQMARKLLKAGNKNVIVLPQNIDWDRFNIPRSKNILEELNIPTDFVVGYVGRLSPEKNIPTLLKCASLRPNVSFVIVGEGPQKGVLQQMASQLKNVYFTGQRQDTEKFYAAFDVLMLPSVMEGLPLVILEAMTSGTPIIASDVGAISEIVTDGVSGLLVWNPTASDLFMHGIDKLRNESFWMNCSNNSRVIAKAMRDKGDNFNINNFYNMLFER